MLHVTYLVTIIEEGQRLFTETVHAHDGNMKLLFVPDGTNPHRMMQIRWAFSMLHLRVREPDKNQWPNIHDAWKIILYYWR